MVAIQLYKIENTVVSYLKLRGPPTLVLSRGPPPSPQHLQITLSFETPQTYV